MWSGNGNWKTLLAHLIPNFSQLWMFSTFIFVLGHFCGSNYWSFLHLIFVWNAGTINLWECPLSLGMITLSMFTLTWYVHFQWQCSLTFGMSTFFENVHSCLECSCSLGISSLAWNVHSLSRWGLRVLLKGPVVAACWCCDLNSIQ